MRFWCETTIILVLEVKIFWNIFFHVYSWHLKWYFAWLLHSRESGVTSSQYIRPRSACSWRYCVQVCMPPVTVTSIVISCTGVMCCRCSDTSANILISWKIQIQLTNFNTCTFNCSMRVCEHSCIRRCKVFLYVAISGLLFVNSIFWSHTQLIVHQNDSIIRWDTITLYSEENIQWHTCFNSDQIEWTKMHHF